MKLKQIVRFTVSLGMISSLSGCLMENPHFADPVRITKGFYKGCRGLAMDQPILNTGEQSKTLVIKLIQCPNINPEQLRFDVVVMKEDVEVER